MKRRHRLCRVRMVAPSTTRASFTLWSWLVSFVPLSLWAVHENNRNPLRVTKRVPSPALPFNKLYLRAFFGSLASSLWISFLHPWKPDSLLLSTIIFGSSDNRQCRDKCKLQQHWCATTVLFGKRKPELYLFQSQNSIYRTIINTHDHRQIYAE